VVVCFFAAGLVVVAVGAGAGVWAGGTTGAGVAACWVPAFVAGCELWACLRGFAVGFAGWVAVVAVVAVVLAAAGAAAACVELVVCVEAELPHPAKAKRAAIAVR